MTVTILEGDCLHQLATIPDNSIDAIVTDPPYGLSNTRPEQVADVIAKWAGGDREAIPTGKGFMGKEWDAFVPPPAVWDECLRVLKPGGHMAVFAGARTQDLMGLSIRLAGFDIRDTLGWVHGSGFPKSLNISKAIDRSNGTNRERQLQFTEWMRSTGITVKEIDEITGTCMGSHYLAPQAQPAIATAELFDMLRPYLPEVPEFVERLVAERTGIEWTDYVKRKVVGVSNNGIAGGTGRHTGTEGAYGYGGKFDITAPASADARVWEGWGTALKPAIEPIILARKPFRGTVAGNVLEWGTGGLNIDACRVPADEVTGWGGRGHAQGGSSLNLSEKGAGDGVPRPVQGRFPANVLFDECAAEELDHQSGDSSRFFPVFKYQAKAPKRERPAITRADGTKIQHPTVKPLALMEWLAALITPPGGHVLDPFAGSGTTLQAARNKGFEATGVERDPDYIELIQQRLGAPPPAEPESPTENHQSPGEPGLFAI